MGLAPDEYAGFTMTLLRMLAFAPADLAGNRKSRADGPEPSASKPRPAEPLRSPEPPLVPAPAARPTPSHPDLHIEDWPAFVKSLRLGGMAGMLAQHCELASCADGRLELRVPDAHRHLMEKAYQDKLRAVLKERLGASLRRVEITVGAAGGQTPAELDTREREVRQSRAIAAIEGDPFVRELVEDLGGRIVPDSVRPLP